jgi:proteasome lid subunit RPN8/RPN11
MMWQQFLRAARLMVEDAARIWRRPTRTEARVAAAATTPREYRPLQRVRLTDGVAHTLFEEYAEHREQARGEEETGWVLLGRREPDEALVLATLPAGAEYDAGVGHVRFNSSGQVLGSRIVRQQDRRLTIVGVVHTHPGSLRHPSDGDFRGDSQWVENLRGAEGVFGIGTADAPAEDHGGAAWQPKLHVHCHGKLRFSWYVLGKGEDRYRPIPVEMTLGPDLARCLHPLWPALEAHADRIDRLFRQQANLTFEVVEGPTPALVLNIPLARAGDALRVVVRAKEVRYLVRLDGELLAVDQSDDLVDRGVYALLAELAAGKD